MMKLIQYVVGFVCISPQDILRTTKEIIYRNKFALG